MESEKVKEIKKALEFQRDGLVYLKDNVIEYVSCKDVLTYINELESKLGEDSVVLTKEEYENSFDIKVYNKLREQNRLLKVFADTLEEKLVKASQEIVNSRKKTIKETIDKIKEKYSKSCSEYFPLFIECLSSDLDEIAKQFGVEVKK